MSGRVYCVKADTRYGYINLSENVIKIEHLGVLGGRSEDSLKVNCRDKKWI